MMYNVAGAGALAGAYGRGAFPGCGFGMPMMGFGLLVLALIVVGVVYFVKKSNNKNSNSAELELLNTRFVKGEITEEEYSRMKAVLKSK